MIPGINEAAACITQGFFALGDPANTVSLRIQVQVVWEPENHSLMLVGYGLLDAVACRRKAA